MRYKMIEVLEFLFTIFGTLCAVTINLALVGAGFLLGVMVAFENMPHTVGVLFVFIGFFTWNAFCNVL